MTRLRKKRPMWPGELPASTDKCRRKENGKRQRKRSLNQCLGPLAHHYLPTKIAQDTIMDQALKPERRSTSIGKFLMKEALQRLTSLFRVDADMNRVLAKDTAPAYDHVEASYKRAKVSADSSPNGVRHRDLEIKREEGVGQYPPRRPTSYSTDDAPPTAPQWNGYKQTYTESPSRRDEHDYSHRPPTRIGAHAITSGSNGALGGRPSNYHRPKTAEEKLHEACPYELRDQQCPLGHHCPKKNICIVSVPAFRP